MGSGSTIAAAMVLGYESIGVEKDAEYFRIAEKAIPALARLDLAGGSWSTSAATKRFETDPHY